MVLLLQLVRLRLFKVLWNMTCSMVGKYKIDITGFFEKLKLSTKQQSITSLNRRVLMLTSISISYLLFKCSTQLDKIVFGHSSQSCYTNNCKIHIFFKTDIVE